MYNYIYIEKKERNQKIEMGRERDEREKRLNIDREKERDTHLKFSSFICIYLIMELFHPLYQQDNQLFYLDGTLFPQVLQGLKRTPVMFDHQKGDYTGGTSTMI